MNALVVDDTPANRDFLEKLMAQAQFHVVGASTGSEALKTADELGDLALALVDMQLPDISGLQVTSELRKRFPHAYIVVATMHDERSLMESVFLKGGNCFLVKPHGFMELFKRLTTFKIQELIEADYLIIDQYGPRRFKTASR